MALTLKALRAHAVTHTLFPPVTLASAVNRLGFVQADPIRSPARAQDLILRHRVKGYRAGDLDREYVSLGLEEDCLYAYGFCTPAVRTLLHPRKLPRLSAIERRVLATVRETGDVHPNTLDASRVVNAWGGYSKATTYALDSLHHRGLLRVARRDNGIRVYQAAPLAVEPPPPRDRLRALVRLTTNIFAPIPEKSLYTRLSPYRALGNPRAEVRDLLRTGELTSGECDGVSYIWSSRDEAAIDTQAPRVVRFLAPFDPLVWNRQRFEQLWGWSYRFEAYTPVAKRVRGYYAMPLLWVDAVIGWANASAVGGRLTVDVGFVGKRPRGAEFTRELDAEIARLARFLGLK